MILWSYCITIVMYYIKFVLTLTVHVAGEMYINIILHCISVSLTVTFGQADVFVSGLPYMTLNSLYCSCLYLANMEETYTSSYFNSSLLTSSTRLTSAPASISVFKRSTRPLTPATITGLQPTCKNTHILRVKVVLYCTSATSQKLIPSYKI